MKVIKNTSVHKSFQVFLLASLLALGTMAVPALAQGTTNTTVNNSFNKTTNTSVQEQDQNCAPVVAQYDNIVQGGANAVAGKTAVAVVANKANVSNRVVINCINGNNNSANVGNPPPKAGGSPSTPTGGTSTVEGTTETGQKTDTSQQAAVRGLASGVIRNSYPNQALLSTGGTTAALAPATPVAAIFVPVGVLLILTSLTTALWLGRRSARRRG